MRFKIESSGFFCSDIDIEKYPCLKKFGYNEKDSTITIYTVDMLLSLVEEVKHHVIIKKEEGKFILEIYDDYRE